MLYPRALSRTFPQDSRITQDIKTLNTRKMQLSRQQLLNRGAVVAAAVAASDVNHPNAPGLPPN